MVTEDFIQTIDFWLKALKPYSFAQLRTKPSPGSWSLGQVYMHLFEQTDYYIEQIKICIAADDNAGEEASPAAKNMFLANEFPDAIIEGPSTNAHTPQPDSKEQLITRLINLKTVIETVGMTIQQSQFNGKTKHPGLNYFSANEWLQFAEMHFRHHLRQKKRIEDFLKRTNAG